MSDQILFGLSPRVAAVVVGAVIGVAFGALAQRTHFCLRRGIAGQPDERQSALGIWAMALAISLLGSAVLWTTGAVDFTHHRLFAARLPVVAVLVGGLLFGAGMVLARGCASRLTVLAGTGNLRALTVLLVFALVAHAALKGVLAPVRTGLGAFAVNIGVLATPSAWPGGSLFWATLIGLALVIGALRSGARWAGLFGGAAIGALAPLAWLATGWLLRDEFDPIPLESIAFTSAGAESLFWWVASSAIPPTFGVGFLAGVVSGSFLAAVASSEFRLVGFSDATPTGHYLAGGALMGLGGVLAGGCTVGAGLAGAGALSLAAALALLAIIAGGVMTASLMRGDWALRSSRLPRLRAAGNG